MDLIPTELVLNEILNKLDERSALSFLMSSPKYRHIIENNIDTYYPIHGDDDIYKILSKDKIITLGRQLLQGYVDHHLVLTASVIVGNSLVVNDYSKFIEYSTDISTSLGINRTYDTLFEYYKNEKSMSTIFDSNNNIIENKYDSNNAILNTLLNRYEEYILYMGKEEREKSENLYTNLLFGLMDARLYDVVQLILRNIYVNVGVLYVISGYDDLGMVQYAMERYIQDGGTYDNINYNFLFDVETNYKDSRYADVMKYLFTLPIKYDYLDIHNQIINNIEIDEEDKKILLSTIPNS
ncbi:Hypothetical protein ORPV_268 [Orpheovirus IHUMI-LCC2]|uniref:Uncharacterized protein n=1 Tax=Orpheovirus IHUMI-LCC2 TaxID=2023057 RepID=A0A2I2L3Q1_9VIRU|nr:Hypothetical protein ORPV_268 [Orpheovirus IHUMI-LCC2]SNW62172.1 Hypothetical protein ORPV_268 [Orpheovirus IHUMI-LCC2]